MKRIEHMSGAGGLTRIVASATLVAATITVTTTALATGSGRAAAQPDGWTATTAPQPTTNNPSNSVALQDVSCPSADFCSAIESPGSDSLGQSLVTLTNGTWTATEAPSPPTGAGPELTGVACVAAGSCVAVGSYGVAGTEDVLPLIETLSGGIWTPTEAQLPADASPVSSNDTIAGYLQGISCGNEGSCVAYGYYSAGQAGYPLLLDTLNNGMWIATDGPMPADAATPFYSGTEPTAFSASCGGSAICTVVGVYQDSSTSNQEAFLDTLAGGMWTTIEAPLPPNAGPLSQLGSWLSSVSCTASLFCVAVGFYVLPNQPGEPMIETFSGGTWTGTEGPLPANPVGGSLYDGVVSCGSADSCTAVDGGGSRLASGNVVPVIDTLSSGVWTPTTAPLPADFSQSASAPYSAVFNVSCIGSTYCVALGEYPITSGRAGLIEELSGGSWAALEAPLPSNATLSPELVLIGSVSCAAPGSCVGVGSYVTASSGLAGLILATGSGSSPPPPPPPASTVSAYLTTGTQTALAAPLSSPIPLTPVTSGTITLNSGTLNSGDVSGPKNGLDGFGVTLTNSSAALLDSLSPSELSNTLNSLFNPTTGAGISVIRLSMGANDFSDGPPGTNCPVAGATCKSSTAEYTYDDMPQPKSANPYCANKKQKTDPTLECFNIFPYDQRIVNILQQAEQISNHRLTIIASPWTAPKWMKTVNSYDGSGGNTLNTNIKGIGSNIYSIYAKYFLKYVQAYAANGITINYVTPQNEPGNETSNYPGMTFPPPQTDNLDPQYSDFVGALSTALSETSTKILAYDWNWPIANTTSCTQKKTEDCWTQAELQTMQTDLSGKIAGIAWHCYTSGGPNPNAMSAFLGPLNFIDECTGTAGSAFGGDLSWDSQSLIVGGLDNGASGVQFFNLALNPLNGPHDGGCKHCRGAVTIDTTTGSVTDRSVTKNVEYWLLTEAARAFSPGATVIANSDASGAALAACENVKDPTGLCVASATNPDGTTGLYVANPTGGPLGFSVDDNGYGFTYPDPLPAHSVVSFRWTNPD